jgi:hypothetical protein
MPQLIALALIGAGAMAGYRWVAKQVDAARQAAEQRQSEGPRDLGQLECDEVSQVYKPRR